MFPNFDDNNKDEDFLNEFRQKLNDQSMQSFEEKKNEINHSKNVFIGAVSGIALAAVVGWFVLSPRYADDPNAEVPVIRRPQSAIKVQPAEPGGMEILNQDKSVYDIIEKKDNTKTVVENLLPPPEQPQLPAITPEPETTPNDKILDQIIAENDSPAVHQAEQIIKVAEAPKITPAEQSNEEDNLVPLSQIATKEAAPTPVEQPKPVAEAPKRPAVSVKIPAKEKVLIPAATTTSTGPWQVQLISSTNQNAVNSAWNGLVKKYSVLKGQPHAVEKADLGAKGIYYRLQAGAFENRSGADSLCNDIKALGGTCIVKKK